MDLVIGIIFDVIATAALVYLFIFGYNSEYEEAATYYRSSAHLYHLEQTRSDDKDTQMA